MNPALSLIFLFGLVLSFAASAQALTDCPHGFTALGDKCILVSREKKSWYDANRRCRALKANLLVFDSLMDADQMKTYLKRQGLEFDRYENALWTAINDIGRNGEFIVEHTGNPMPFDNWEIGQPDRAGNQDCVATYGANELRYHDFQCDFKLMYVCIGV